MTPPGPPHPDDEGDAELPELADLFAEDDAPLPLDDDEPLDGDLADWGDHEGDDDVSLPVPDDDGDAFTDLTDDAEDDDIHVDLSDDETPLGLDDAPTIVPWRGVATLTSPNREVPCLADATAEHSSLTTPSPEAPQVSLTLAFHGLCGTWLVATTAGPEVRLVLGRDVLSGRALIRP